MSRLPILRLFICLLSAGFAVWFGFFAWDSAQAIQWVKLGGYWLLLLTFLMLVYAAYRLWIQGGKSWPNINRYELGFLAICSLLVFSMQPSGYKITMDEPVLAATSLQMHLEREVLTVSRAYEVGGVFTSLGGYVDKRPYFYPFLLSLLHDTTGYRAQQGVVLNALLAPLFLLLLYLSGRAFASAAGGYLAVLLFIGVPLLAMNANGAGFELLNLVMILLTGFSAHRYLKKTDVVSLNVLLLLTVLLAQTRYESALYVLPVAVIIILGWWRSGAICISPTLMLTPLLLVSIPLQQLIFRDYPALWQLDHNGVEQPFGCSYIADNLWHAGQYFFGTFQSQPSSCWLSVLFLLLLPIGLILLLRRGRSCFLQQPPLAWVSLLFGLTLAASFFLLMAYHWGQIDDIVATRLILPFVLLQVLAVVLCLRALPARMNLLPICLGLSLVYFILVARPLSARSDFLQWARPLSEVNYLVEKARAYSGQSALFISNRHLAALAEKVSAIPVTDALRRKAQLDLHQRLKTFDPILFMYLSPIGPVADYDADQVRAEAQQAALAAAFCMKTIERIKLDDRFELQFAQLEFVRLAPAQQLQIDGFNPQDAELSALQLEQFSETLP